MCTCGERTASEWQAESEAGRTSVSACSGQRTGVRLPIHILVQAIHLYVQAVHAHQLYVCPRDCMGSTLLPDNSPTVVHGSQA